jgi:hypothetical protein
MDWGMTQMVEHLLRKCKTLNSKAGTTKKRTKKKLFKHF